MMFCVRNSMNLTTTQEKDDDISSIVPAVVPAVGNLHPVSRRTRTLTRTPSSIYSVERRPSSMDRWVFVKWIFICICPLWIFIRVRLICKFLASKVRSSNFWTGGLGIAYSQSAELEIAIGLENGYDATDDTRESSNGGDDSISKDGRDSTRALPLWLADSTPNEFTVCQVMAGAAISPFYL